MSRSKGPRTKTTIRLPRGLTSRLTTLARAQGISLNDWMVEALVKEAGIPVSRRRGRPSPTMDVLSPPLRAGLLNYAKTEVGEVVVTGRDGSTFLAHLVGGEADHRFWVSRHRLRFRDALVPPGEVVGEPDATPFFRDLNDLRTVALINMRFVGISEDAEFTPGVPRTTGFWSYRIFFDDGRLKITGSSRGPERDKALAAATRNAAWAGFTHYRLLAGNGDVVRLPKYRGRDASTPEVVSP